MNVSTRPRIYRLPAESARMLSLKASGTIKTYEALVPGKITFLDLPYEIRSLIYQMVYHKVRYVQMRKHHFFESSHRVEQNVSDLFKGGINDVAIFQFKHAPVCPRRRCNCAGSNTTGPRKGAWWVKCKETPRGETCWCSPNEHAVAGLLYICRAIFQEALPFAYERNHFRWWTPGEMISFCKGIRSHQRTSFVKRLELCYRLEEVPSYSLERAFDVMKPASIAREFPYLEYLNVDIDISESKGLVHEYGWAQEQPHRIHGIFIRLAGQIKGLQLLSLHVGGHLDEELVRSYGRGLMWNQWYFPPWFCESSTTWGHYHTLFGKQWIVPIPQPETFKKAVEDVEDEYAGYLLDV